MLASGTLIPFLVALSFAAGLNTYATTLTLGLLGRLHWVTLPQGLEVLTHTWVLAASGALFCCEMFADKIPYVDLLWNFAHTFVRVPVAGLLAYKASSQLTPGMQALVVVLSGVIAAVAHGSKTAARTAVSVSPEPVSNIVLSSSEDIAAVGLTWVATKHPVGAGIAAGVAVIAAVFATRWIVGSLRRQVGRLRERFGGEQRLGLETGSRG